MLCQTCSNWAFEDFSAAVNGHHPTCLDKDFVKSLEGDEIVVRYKGKECLRGKYVAPVDFYIPHATAVFLESLLEEDDDVKPDFEVNG